MPRPPWRAEREPRQAGALDPVGAAGFQVYVWKNQNVAIGVVDNMSLAAVA